MIYLDTHVVVWLYAGEIEKLSRVVKELINENEIFISPIVKLELQYLFEVQRVRDEANEILLDLSERIGLKISERNFHSVVTNAIAFSWTRDPFDRIIVANASINKNILLTKDKNILENYENAIW